jgi:hypothetical protein
VILAGAVCKVASKYFETQKPLSPRAVFVFWPYNAFNFRSKMLIRTSQFAEADLDDSLTNKVL